MRTLDVNPMEGGETGFILLSKEDRFGFAKTAKEQMGYVDMATEFGDHLFVRKVADGRLKTPFVSVVRHAKDRIQMSACNKVDEVVDLIRRSGPEMSHSYLGGILTIARARWATVRTKEKAIDAMVALVKEGSLNRKAKGEIFLFLEDLIGRKSVQKSTRGAAVIALTQVKAAIMGIDIGDFPEIKRNPWRMNTSFGGEASAKHREFVKGKAPGKKGPAKTPGPLKRKR